MDWTNRDVKPSAEAHTGTVATKHTRRRGPSGMLRLAMVLFLFAATILVVATVIYLAIGGPKIKEENKYVDSKKLQAVFLNGGQVYFGNITNLNSKYIRLVNIYYLKVNQNVQPADQNKPENIALQPLGCELHRPQREMLINREQVVFWENLKDETSTSTVPGAIKKYTADNPNGPKCDEAATTTTNTNTTPASTSTTKKQ